MTKTVIIKMAMTKKVLIDGRDGYNPDGFNREGINETTGTYYDEAGYDKEGYNKEGFDEYGIHRETGTPYDPEGFNMYGLDKEGFGRDGYNPDGFNREGIHKETGTPYDPEGIDMYGHKSPLRKKKDRLAELKKEEDTISYAEGIVKQMEGEKTDEDKIDREIF